MERVLSQDLSKHIGEQVSLQGWLHRVRELANVAFLILRDREGLVQIVVRDEALRVQLGSLVEETVIEVHGPVIANDKAPLGCEVIDPVITVLSPALQPPFELWRPSLGATLPTLLDHAAVSLRHLKRRTTFQISAASMRGFRATLDALGFTEVSTPKVTATATESGANVFSMDWFGRRAFLAQSPQFYKQTMVGVFERVYETGPVFRAEPHDTTRHLASYTSLDVELGFIHDHYDVMAVLREVLAGMVAAVRMVPGYENALESPLPGVPEQIPVVHFAKAQELIAEHTDEDPRGEPDLAPNHERWLSEWALREHDSDFLFVAGYPMGKRPFYTHPQVDDPQYSNSFDLLFRGLELVTGGQRLHRYEDYVAAITGRGETLDAYEGYLEAFKHGMPPHGGFAIGLERWVARITGAANIREVTLFPRDLNRLTP